MSDKIRRADYLADKLNKLTDARGITSRDQLSKLTQVGKPTLYRYLDGKAAQPDAFMLVKLANFFGVTTDYLLGTDNPDVERRPTELATVEV